MTTFAGVKHSMIKHTIVIIDDTEFFCIALYFCEVKWKRIDFNERLLILCFFSRTKENKGKDDKGKDKEKEKGKPSDKSEKEKPPEKTPTKSGTASSSVSSAPLGAVSTTSTSIAVKRKVDTSAMANKRARKEAHSSSKLMKGVSKCLSSVSVMLRGLESLTPFEWDTSIAG